MFLGHTSRLVTMAGPPQLSYLEPPLDAPMDRLGLMNVSELYIKYLISG